MNQRLQKAEMSEYPSLERASPSKGVFTISACLSIIKIVRKGCSSMYHSACCTTAAFSN